MIYNEITTSGTIPKYLRVTIDRKAASPIDSWQDWPADVIDKLRALNLKRRLRFPYTSRCGTFPIQGIAGGFACGRCLVDCMPHKFGDACLDGVFYCDDCMIAMARGGEL